jgi:hypothetical protein
MDKIFLPDNLIDMVSPQSDSFDHLISMRDKGIDIYKRYDSREKFRTGVSWHVPTQSLIDLLKSHSPLVSIGSGFAYTESIAKGQGADIIPTDINPNSGNGWCRNGEYFCDVEEIEAVSAVKKYKDRNVFMAWPPYDTSMAYDVALNMVPGSYLIYVGEGWGGCNGDDQFFEYLNNQFEETNYLAIPKWFGLNDYCSVYRKKDTK